jgi:cell division protein FtsW (lipid II flippase)
MKQKRKNLWAKIVAGIALFAILLGLMGTGILMLSSSVSAPSQEISQEDLQKLLESMSWASLSWAQDTESFDL